MISNRIIIITALKLLFFKFLIDLDILCFCIHCDYIWGFCFFPSNTSSIILMFNCCQVISNIHRFISDLYQDLQT